MILFLKPHFEVKPWAGNNLINMYDCPNGTGEAWIVSGYKGKSSVIQNGKYKGQTLRHLWIKHPELFGEYTDKEFPILLKIIDAGDDLSVQVHPNDEYALKHHNSLGKFECWYILNKTSNSNIIAGVDAKSRVELSKYINDNILEKKLKNREILRDDLIIIEPGTVHAIKKNTVLLEVQESSDITYRLFDYNREPRRDLHIEDSLNVIRYNDEHNPIHNFQNDDKYINNHFTFEKITINGSYSRLIHTFKICYVVEGSCEIGDSYMNQGDVCIITIDQGDIKINGNAKIILITPKKKEKESLKMRKVALITGITTQNGSYLADLLLEKDYEVHALVTSMSEKKRSSISHLVNNDNVMGKSLFFHLGDLTDSSNLNRLIENVKPDEIYHFASQNHVDVSFEIPEYTTNVNAMGTLRILDAIKQSDLRTKIYCESSCLILDGNQDSVPQSLNTKLNPTNPFATSKLYAYYITKNYRDSYGIYAVNGIVFNQTSERESEDFVASKIINSVKRIFDGTQDILTIGNLYSSRDWGYAKDYVEGVWRSLQEKKPRDYIFSTGETHSVKELIEVSFGHFNINIRWIDEGLQEYAVDEKTGKVLVKVDSKYYRPDNKIYCGDFSMTKDLIDWSPKYSFKDLIDLMIGEKNEDFS